MDAKKKAQLVTLAVTAVIVAAVGAGVYVWNREPGRGPEPGGEVLAEGASGSAAAAENAGVAENAGAAENAGMAENAGTAENAGAGPDSPREVGDGQEAGGIAAAGDVPGTAIAAQESEAGPAPETIVEDGLIRVSGGTFTMGSPESERQRGTDEASHEISLRPFYVDPYEVTQRDYEALMGENPSFFRGEELPVENVTWYEAVAYCNRLSESRGLTPVYTVEGDTVTWDRSANGYRLLTEAEWEYAARAGTQTIYWFGNQVHSDYANFEGSYPYLIEENYVTHTNPDVVTSQNRGTTMAVDTLDPNAFGLYHVLGNVAEWCFDYYGAYDGAEGVDPAGAASGSLRVNRGGSYNDFGKHLRSAYRSAANPVDADQNLGFRIARNAEGIDETVTTTYSLDIAIPENPRILIAYFSYSGNTENATEILRDKTGADLFEITMETPYNGNIYDASQYDLMNDIHPALAAHVENMQQYDVILLGYPYMEQGFHCILCA